MVCEGLKPLETWIEEPSHEDECKPCALAALIPEYQQALKESGRQDLVDELTSGLENPDDPIREVAKKMDAIKAKVEGELRAILESLDCMAQKKL